jgi:hypothetical protein
MAKRPRPTRKSARKAARKSTRKSTRKSAPRKSAKRKSARTSARGSARKPARKSARKTARARKSAPRTSARKAAPRSEAATIVVAEAVSFGISEETLAPAPAPAPGLARARAFVAGPTAIDISQPLPDKVRALWDILGRVVADLDGSASAAKQRVIKTFLLHLAGHESQLRTRAQDANGPARSLFQLEAHRAKDAGQHAQAVNLMGTLATAAGTGPSPDDFSAAFKALPTFDLAHPNQSAFFPAGNLIESTLVTNDLFAAYLVRIDFRRFPDPIPDGNEAQAAYWLKFWKGSASNPDAVKKQFLDDARRVDPHIPA